MEEKEYDVGQTVYIGVGQSSLSKGEIVHKFEHYNQMQYVIEVQTGIEPVLFVRDWGTISTKKKGLLNWLTLIRR